MKAVKAIYENGKIKLSEKPAQEGPAEVVVVFPESEPDKWQKILDDPRPRPKLNKLVDQVKRQIAQGKAKPLNLDDL